MNYDSLAQDIVNALHNEGHTWVNRLAVLMWLNRQDEDDLIAQPVSVLAEWFINNN